MHTGNFRSENFLQSLPLRMFSERYKERNFLSENTVFAVILTHKINATAKTPYLYTVVILSSHHLFQSRAGKDQIKRIFFP